MSSRCSYWTGASVPITGERGMRSGRAWRPSGYSSRAFRLPEVMLRNAGPSGLAAAIGVPLLPCDGTYFLVLDASQWMRPDEDDVAFCRRLVVDGGLVLIPMSAFYETAPPRHLVRACFCKEDATIDGALQRLQSWAAKQR